MTNDELHADRAEVFGSLFALMQHLSRRADQELADLGLTSRQWLLLAILAKPFAGSSPSLSEAAAKYGSSRQNVKQVALGLAGPRLRATRARSRRREDHPDRADRADPRVRHPPDGARTRDMFDDVFTGLTPDETHGLLALLRRWLATLTTPEPGEVRPS